MACCVLSSALGVSHLPPTQLPIVNPDAQFAQLYRFH